MAVTYSATVTQAMLNAYESTIGTAPKLRLYTGSAPAIGSAATGTLLAELSLPSDWMAAASGTSVAKTGTWSGTAAAAGTAGYYRIVDTAGTNTHEQGSVTATGGGGDLTLDNTSIASGQAISITTFTKTLTPV